VIGVVGKSRGGLIIEPTQTAPLDANDADVARRESVASSPAAVWVVVGVLLAVAASRFAVLAADPPDWMPDAFLTDAGWWANGARGRVLFGDYFSEDFGMGYLVTPAYTWVLAALYRLWGVSLVHAQVLGALCNTLMVAAVALLVWRCVGRVPAVVAAGLLGASPYFWAYGRVALPESPQLLCIVAAYLLWFLPGRTRARAAAAGLCLAAALAVKPNAVTYGLVPFGLAALAQHWLERRQAPCATARAALFTDALYACGGMAIALTALALVLVLPHWASFSKLMLSESGANEVRWNERLGFASFALMSLDYGPSGELVPVLWRLARWSPAILTGAWLYLIAFTLRIRGGVRGLAGAVSPFELGVVVWAVGTAWCLFTSDRQYDYRQQVLLPPLAILAALFVTGSRRPTGPPAAAPTGYGYTLCLWALLLLPLMVVLKAAATRLTLVYTATLPIGDDLGLDLGSAGIPFLVAWLVLLVLLARLSTAAVRLAAACSAPPARIVVALLLILELAVVGRDLLHPEMTLVERQRELAHYVGDGDTVAGKMAATLFHPLRVHTVRRVAPEASPDVFDFDAVWSGVRPRYVLATHRLNYAPYQPFPALAQLLADKGYAEVFHFDLGAQRDGVSRFELGLYRSPATNAPAAGPPDG
jgi:hypothetical protein